MSYKLAKVTKYAMIQQAVNEDYKVMESYAVVSNRASFILLLFNSYRRDAQGNNGISYVVRVTLHLLDPRGPEFTASFVGRLVSTLVKKVSDVV